MSHPKIVVTMVLAVLGTTAQAGAPMEPEQQILTASDAAGAVFFGQSVSVSNSRALIGAQGVDVAAPNGGAAYVFEYDPQTRLWTEVTQLTGSDAASGDALGVAVVLEGDRAVVGAPTDNSGIGKAYVFERDTGSGLWFETQILTADDGEAGDTFGRAVSLDGGILMVGADGDDDAASGAGAAYVFEPAPGSGQWVQTDKLTASDPSLNSWLGAALSVSGDRVLVGARGSEGLQSRSGAAYLFVECPRYGGHRQASI